MIEVRHVMPTRNERMWRFCGRCGLPMLWRRRAGKAFSRVTGEPTDLYNWSCPDWNMSDEGKRHDMLGRAYEADER